MKTSWTKDWVRPAAVAGTFYPEDPAVLRRELGRFCPAQEEKETSRAIVAPHAGYVYSGRFAGQVYRRVKIPQTAVILCPNHTGQGKRVSVWPSGAWQTPLGEAPIDEALAAELLTAFDEREGDSAAHRSEHACEVHVPFLQFLRPDIRIVPIVLGPLPPDRCRAIGEALARVIGERDILVVASTDMSHYIPAKDAAVLDRMALDEVAKVDGKALYDVVRREEISMCGFIPTSCTLFAAKKWGLSEAEIVAYGHSGEVTGDSQSVVAYASAVLR